MRQSRLIWISTYSKRMSEFNRCPKLPDFTLRDMNFLRLFPIFSFLSLLFFMCVLILTTKMGQAYVYGWSIDDTCWYLHQNRQYENLNIKGSNCFFFLKLYVNHILYVSYFWLVDVHLEQDSQDWFWLPRKYQASQVISGSPQNIWNLAYPQNIFISCTLTLKNT